MQCKACSTRIDPGHSVCPNCGRTTGPTLAPVSGNRTMGGGQGKSAGQGKAPAQRKTSASTKASASKTSPQAKASSRPPVAKAIDLELEDIADEMLDDTSDETSDRAQVLPTGPGPKPSELRATLAGQPDLLGADLSIYSGKKSGIRFPTEVGEIDVLLVDDLGNLVVVMIPDPESPGDSVSDVLQRIGWVCKHVAEGAQEVRGIVLVPPMPEDLSYAAAAVSGTVSFLTYQMSISFEELEI